MYFKKPISAFYILIYLALEAHNMTAITKNKSVALIIPARYTTDAFSYYMMGMVSLIVLIAPLTYIVIPIPNNI